MNSQYDSIAAVYSMAEVLPFRPYVELFTVLQLVGNVEGKTILDVACGDGLYSRIFKQRGAAKVVGTDMSEGMVKAAQQIEEQTSLGIEYLACDAAEMPVLGSFDMVTAMYLLHYASSKEQMLKMCRSMYANLKDGGRLVTITANPDFNPKGPNSTKYGISMRFPDPVREGDKIFAEVHITPPFELQLYSWSRAAYEGALRDAGFKNITWIRPQCSPEGEAKYGKEFWRDYLENPHAVPVTCEK